MKKKMMIEGMKCMHCKASVENALKSVEGVTDAVVDLESKTAVITLSTDIPDAVLLDAVKAKGFEPQAIS